MRATLGAGLLLVSATLVGLAATPAEAASVCDDAAADTTWVGPAAPEGSTSWDIASNWTNGVPGVTSTACIPSAVPGPLVPGETVAEAAGVTLEGTLTVAGILDVATLAGDFGELHGPGSTTVADGITGNGLTLRDAAGVDLQNGPLGGELDVYDGSRLNVRGDTELEPGVRIDSLSADPGLFTITESGTLTFDTPNGFADVIGGFANHGAVNVAAGYVWMIGADPGDAHPDQFSTGTFTGSSEATFNVGNTELRSDALLDHVTWVDHITVPSGSTATIADSTLTDMGEWGPTTVTGAGHLLLTDGSIADAHIGGSLAVTIPVGEVVGTGDAVVQDQARIRVDGELRGGNVTLSDDAVLDVFGVHRGAAPSAGIFSAISSGDDPGVEIIHPTGRLVSDENSGVMMAAPFVNYGTVDSGTGFIYLGPEAESPSASSGTFRADPGGRLLLGSGVDGAPPLELAQSVMDGAVDISGPVTATDTEVRGAISTLPGGRLALEGHTRMVDESSIAGDVTLAGDLDADLSPTGTASLSGAEVTADVYVYAGTFSAPSLGPATLTEDGTLTQGRWFAQRGATLDLPAITTNDTWLQLGRGASFGDGLANLTANGPNGNLLLGDDLSVPGRFRNEGVLALAPRSRLDVGGKFRQLATATLVTGLDATGRGRVRAAGLRDLAGELFVDRDPAYKPPVGTVLSFISSGGAKTADNGFDSVTSPRYGTHKQLRPAYDTNHVRLRVERVG